MIRADLHTHTSASDGQQSPESLIRMAAQYQLDVIAITDHDTTMGLAPAQAAAGSSLMVIPGVEIGARSGDVKVDMLGYFIDEHHAGFRARLNQFRQNRDQRGQMILERLAWLGVPVSWAHVTALARGDSIGRPHIARALVEAGHVRSVKEAFERFIGSAGPAYVARDTLTPVEAIQLIHAAGGVAVLAHPVFVRDFPAVVDQLTPAGLDGIEVTYPQHLPDIEARVRDLAVQYGLIMTGGSDFHGADVAGKSHLGAALAPPDAVDKLRERAAHYQVAASAPPSGD
jgi:predicted metal-dependent phosphoesterase TrpH